MRGPRTVPYMFWGSASLLASSINSLYFQLNALASSINSLYFQLNAPETGNILVFRVYCRKHFVQYRVAKCDAI